MWRPQGVGPGERKVWVALLFLGWVILMLILLATLDPSVVCSNTQPC